MIEKKVKVIAFKKRINTSLFAMTAVDAWFLFSGIRQGSKYKIYEERHFYEALYEQLIDIKLDCKQASTWRGDKRYTDAELLLQEQEEMDRSHLICSLLE